MNAFDFAHAEPWWTLIYLVAAPWSLGAAVARIIAAVKGTK